jgi:RNA polymerase sigma-70 factor (ECF subfamily)
MVNGSAATLRFAVTPAAVARDAEWARRGAAGDRDALGAIARAYQDRVYGLLLKLSGNPEVALDLSQETFVRAFRALKSFRGGSLGPWLLKIANNLFLDHVRASRTESFEAFLAADPGREPAADDPALAAFDDATDLADALLTLPVPWRQALALRYVDDMDYETIAEVLDVPLGTVKTWLFRGRERLRAQLKGGVS